MLESIVALMTFAVVSGQTPVDPPTQIIALEQAHAALPNPQHLLDIAAAYAAWPGHCAEARAAFEAFFSACPSCEALADGRRRHADVKSACAGTVELTHDFGRDGRLAIDEAAVTAKGPQSLWPGAHLARYIDARGRSWQRRFCVAAGQSTAVKLSESDSRTYRLPSDAPPKIRATRHEAAAIAHLRQQALCEAASELSEAHANIPRATVLFNLGLVYDKWPGHCGPAIEAFTEYLGTCKADCAQRSAAEKKRAELTPACQGRIVVATAPWGEAITVDGRTLGSSPVTADVLPGRHTVAATHDGERIERLVYVETGATRAVTLQFSGRAEVPTPVATTKPKEAPVVEASPQPSPPRSSSGVWGWTAIGVGGVAAIVGTVFALRVASDNGKVQDLVDGAGTSTEPIRPQIEVLASKMNREGPIAYVGWAVGAIAIGGGVALLLLDASDAPVAIAPSPSGAALVGRF